MHNPTLSLSIDCNKKDVGGNNALHAACWSSTEEDITEMMKLLIDRYSRTLLG